MTTDRAPSPIDEHLARFGDAQRSALSRTCDVIRAALPGAVEVISYGMPTFKVGGEKGVAVMGIEGFAAHNSLFPYSGVVPGEFADQLAGYVQTKGSIHFDRDRPFPAPLLKRILKTRIQEINATFPKKGGEMREYYDNGHLKLVGKMSGDVMSGAWRWYRRDGTIMRSGSFRRGERVGEWATYDATGATHKVTRLG